MLKVPLRICAGAICASGLLVLVSGAAAATNAADPSSQVAPPPSPSVFTNYRSYRDQKYEDWRKANDEVERAGGHLGIMREQARQQAAKPAAVPAPAAKSPPHPAGVPR